METIRNTINNNNLDMIYLIDCTNHLEFMFLNGFNKYTDGRNLLFIKDNLVCNVKIDKNCMIVDNKYVFCYIPNNKDKDHINKIKYFINKNYIVYGDFNLKSNKNIYNVVSKFNGEDSLQTGVINAKILKLNKINAPSDHFMIYIKMKMKFKFKLNLKLKEISYENTANQVEKILSNKKFEFRPKISVRKYNNSFKDRDVLNNELLDLYINNDIRKAYKKYNYLWRAFRREPFLGTYVNENIINGFKNHLRHNDNKNYDDLLKDDNVFVNVENLIKTKSKALNYDYCQLNSIAKALIAYVNKNINDKSLKYSTLNNVIDAINKMKGKLYANTFFLVKNPKLNDFGDVRCIIIMPTLVKLFETLIFNDIEDYLSNYLIKQKYQYGGIKNGSTYSALVDLRMKNKRDNSNNMIFLDMQKGYDSIDFDLLINMIQEKIDDRRIGTLLINWALLIRNLNIDMNGVMIKKMRGIPMGCSLSPIIFSFYLDCILNDFDKNICVAYLDDIAISIPYTFSPEVAKEYLLGLTKKLAEYGLIINLKKSFALSVDKLFINKMKDIIPCKDKDKYLGRQLCINKFGKIVNDDRFYLTGKTVLGRPSWINFSIKRLIFNGAIDARIRYKFFMWPTSDKLVRNKIWTNMWQFFKNNNSYFSYVQLSFVCLNIFRYMLDPITIQELNLSVINNNNEVHVKMINNKLKNMLKCGKEQIDSIIDKLNPIWSDNKLLVLSNILSVTKNFTEILWNQFKENMLLNYIEKKRNDNIDVFSNITYDSKIIKNVSWVQDILFNRVNKVKFKQIIIWQYLDELSSMYNDWENKNYDGIININDIIIKKYKFGLKMNEQNWNDYAIKKNKMYWPLLNKIIKLENKSKNKVKFNINKCYNKARDKVNNNKNLMPYEVFLLSLSYNQLEEYADIRNDFLKSKYNNLKMSFSLILKKFIILDSIYCDKYYNSSSYYELYYNVIFKFEDLDIIADKIVEVIHQEKNLLYF